MLSEKYITLVLANRLYERSNGAISDFSQGSPCWALLSILAFAIAEMEYAVGTLPDSMLERLSELWGQEKTTDATAAVALFTFVPVDKNSVTVVPPKARVFGNGIIFETIGETVIQPGENGEITCRCTVAGEIGNIEPFSCRSIERKYAGLIERAFNTTFGVGGKERESTEEWLNRVGSVRGIISLQDVELEAYKLINRVPIESKIENAEIEESAKYPLAKVKAYQNYSPDYTLSNGFVLLLIAWSSSFTQYVTADLTDFIENRLTPYIPIGNTLHCRSAEHVGIKLELEVQHTSDADRLELNQKIKKYILADWANVGIGSIPNGRLGEKIEFLLKENDGITCYVSCKFYYRFYPTRLNSVLTLTPWQYWDIGSLAQVEFYQYCILDSAITTFKAKDNLSIDEVMVTYELLALIDAGEPA